MVGFLIWFFMKQMKNTSLQACLASMNAVFPQVCHETPELLNAITNSPEVTLSLTQTTILTQNSIKKLDCKNCNLPNDPWGRPFVVEIRSSELGLFVEVYSLGPDGRKGTKDDVHQVR